VIRVVLFVRFAGHAKILARDEPQESLVACLVIITFPCAEKLLISLLPRRVFG
jgi:hypothetical protein